MSAEMADKLDADLEAETVADTTKDTRKFKNPINIWLYVCVPSSKLEP